MFVKRGALIIVSIGIVLGIIAVFLVTKKSKGPDNTQEEPEVVTEEKESQQYLTEGMMLRATGTVSQVISDSGGLPEGDPFIPPVEYIISLDDSPVEGVGGVRISDTGCIDPGLWKNDRVVVSGTIVRIIPDVGIILTCDHGARVEHIR